MLYKLAATPAFQKMKLPSYWLGIVLVLVLAAVSMYISSFPLVLSSGLSALTIAILLGIVIGNTFFSRIATHTDTGVDFSKNILLRLGIILYGFRITFQEIQLVGWSGLVIAILMIGCTFMLAMFLGVKVFKLDKQSVMLIGAGSSICGAAAVMAAEPIIKGQAHKVSVAVATVVVFGTIAMFIYPMAYPFLGLSEHVYGVFVGASIHEVAQAVVAGDVGTTAASVSVIEKMLRVMLLAPFLVILSTFVVKKDHNHDHAHHKTKITIPWFAVWFIVAAIVNSVITMPAGLSKAIIWVDTLALTMAMGALGIRTHLGAIKQAGIKPLLLGACLFVFLIVGGLGITLGVSYIL